MTIYVYVGEYSFVKKNRALAQSLRKPAETNALRTAIHHGFHNAQQTCLIVIISLVTVTRRHRWSRHDQGAARANQTTRSSCLGKACEKHGPALGDLIPTASFKEL